MREKNLIPADVLREASTEDPLELVHLGITAAKSERFERGLVLLTEAYNRFMTDVKNPAPTPGKLVDDSGAIARKKMPTLLLSYLGLCLAMTKGRYREAARYCEMAIRREGFHVDHFVNLARVWQAGRSRKNMVDAIDRGLSVARAPALLALREEFGARKTPVVPFLTRDNPLNRTLGKLRHKLARPQHGVVAAIPRRAPATSDVIDLDDEEAAPRPRTRPGGRPRGR